MISPRDSCSMLPRHWQYRGEGGMNVILRYTGPDPSLQGRVIRLRKCPMLPAATGLPPLPSDTYTQYVQHVVRPVFGVQFIADPILLPINSELLAEMSINIAPLRPAHRRAMAIDTDQVVASILPDLCVPFSRDGMPSAFSTLCVELKPKSGVCPATTFLAADLRAFKTTFCRFCMQQELKICDKKELRRSTYCPIDLFSGDATRMSHAISQLLLHPQNNIQIFVDGNPIFSQSLATDDNNAFCIGEIRKCLGAHFTSNEHWHEIVGDLMVTALQHTGVLDAILRVQELDYCDIEGIAHMILAWYSSQHTDSSHASPSCVDRALDALLQTDEAKAAFTDGYFIPRDALDIDTFFRKRVIDSTSIPSTLELVFLLQQFLVAATAKDCSVMIALQQIGDKPLSRAEGANRLICQRGLEWNFNCGVVDLDPKNICKLPYYLKHDRKIVQNFGLQRHQFDPCY